MNMFLKAAKIDQALIRLYIDDVDDRDGMDDVDTEMLKSIVFEFINKVPRSSKAHLFDMLNAK